MALGGFVSLQTDEFIDLSFWVAGCFLLAGFLGSPYGLGGADVFVPLLALRLKVDVHYAR